MKFISRCLLFLLLFLTSIEGHSSHVSGGNITWTCTGANTYLLTLTLYRDCDGISMPNTINTNVTANPTFTSSSFSISNSCGLNPTFTGPTTLNLVSNTEVSQLCPPQIAQSECSGGTLPGMEEYVYQTEIILPDCDCWTFSYTLCCRNNAITNLANPASDYSTIQSTLCNGNGPSCNNSPDFTAQPIPYICNNTPFCYDYGVVEPDGNTLSYAFTSALNSGNPSGYSAGYNFNAPIPGITIDPLTGQICFTPNTNGNFVVTIMVTETDAAGNVIGTYMQDIQFVIMNCPNAPPSAPNNLTNVTGSGTVTGNTSIQLCENDNFCAELVFTDADAVDIITLSSNIAAVLPGATITINNGSPASATVCWTENIGGPAFYSFSVDAIDDACPIPGINSFTVDVTVLNSTDPACFNCNLTASILAQDNVSCSGLSDGSLSVTQSSGTPNYQYSIDGGVSWQNSSVFNGLSASNYTITVEDATPCQATVTATVTEPTPVSVSINNTVNTTCNGSSDGSLTAVGSGGTPNYQYSIDGVVFQSTGDFTGLTAGSYTITVEDDNGCQSTVSGTVTEPTLLTGTINTTTDATCGLANGSFTVQGVDGTPGYQYSTDGGVTWQSSGTFPAIMPGNYLVNIEDANNCGTTLNVVINDLSGITASISSQSAVSCHGGNDGDVTVLASGSTAPYQYSIDGGTIWQAAGFFSTLSAGNNTVISEDANGCQFPVTVLITEPTLLLSNVVTSNNTQCYNSCDGNVDISVSGGTSPYVFSWTGPNSFSETIEDVNGLCAGTYDLSVSDVNMCLTTLSVTINEPSEVSITTNFVNSNCGQTDGGVSVSASGGTISTDYNYEWYQAGNLIASTSVVSNLAGGSYDVVVNDDNGCSASANQSITDLASGTASAIEDVMVSCYGLCNGQGTASISGGTAPFTYLWNSGSTPTQPTTAGLCAGINTVTITDDIGCVSVATVVINEPDTIYATITLANETCIGDCQGSIDLTAIGGTPPYLYSFDNGANFGNVSSLSSLCANNYNIEIKDFNGCSYVISVEVLPGIQYSDATISNVIPVCENAPPFILNAVDPGGVWVGPGMQNNEFNPLVVGDGVHTISYEISSVCGDTGYIDVVVNPLPEVSFVADIYDGCEPLEVNFTSTGTLGVSCLWDFGDGGTSSNCGLATNNYLSAGTYDVSLTVIDANNCESSYIESAMINVYPLPEANFTFNPQTTTIVDPIIYFTDQSLNASQWSWDFQIGSSIIQNPIFDFENTGTFQVELLVTSIDGCTDLAYDTVLIEDQFLVYVPNAFTPNDNGVNEIFLPVFNGLDPVNYDFYIFNRWGELIFDAHHPDVGWDGTYNGVKSPEGVYVYKIIARDQINGEMREFVGHINLLR